MAHHGPWLALLDKLVLRLDAHKAHPSPDKKTRSKIFVNILQDICTVVRSAEANAPPELSQVLEQAHVMLDSTLQYAYSQYGGFSSLPTFAHSDDEPYVEDALENAGSDVLDAFVKFYKSLLKPGAPAPKLPTFARIRPWTKSPHPHPLTTRLSRFRGGFPSSASQTTPLARIIYHARAQLTIDTLSSPLFDFALSSRGSILVTSYGRGWKAKNPVLQYYLLDHQSSDYLEGVTMDPGLSSVAHYLATAESQKLVFTADVDRIKSFSFAPDDAGKVPKALPNVHTMDSECDFSGPIILVASDRLARAGKGKVAIWNLNTLQRHQDSPGELIGQGKVNLDHCAREGGCRDIEMSSGSKADSVVAFTDDPTFFPSAWHVREQSSHLLCGEDAELSGGYACVSIDLEHGGKRAARYLGHGGEVEKFATSTGDPNVFVTAGSDGYARLFDVRRPLPVLTFNTGLQREACNDVVLVHPDGIPTLFTGGDVTQQVKMWDIRAEECVYELSTGNNAVSGLAWDHARSSLFVATECRLVNRMGIRSGYRRARVPRWATWKAVEKDYTAYKESVKNGADVSEDEKGACGEKDYPDVYDDYLDDGEEEECEDDEQEDIDEGYSADMRWPQKCFHKEDFFGYAYDAGEHVLLRWQFKDTPDIIQLPASTTCD